jgi:hypothetical protein
MSFLVKFAATNVYQYTLDTEDLSVIRGASNQLDDFVEKIPRVLEDAGITARIVYDGASEILLSVDTKPEADKAKTAISKLLNDELKGATGAVASVEIPSADMLPQAMIRLETELRRAQLAAPAVIPPPNCGGSKACEIEGVRPAGSRKARGKEVSDHTYERYKRGRRFRTRLLERIFDEQAVKVIDMTKWEQSFEGLKALNEGGAAKQAVRGKMCVIHADGNSFGGCRKKLTSLDGLTAFSKLVEQSLFETLRSSLTELLNRGKTARFRRPKPEPESEGVLPFHILYLAGDEFALVLPAAYGVRVARALLSGFSSTVSEKLKLPEFIAVRNAVDGTLTLSVGMAACDTHEPIQRASALARDLCEGAKERVKAPFDAEEGNVIDFAIIESGFLPGGAEQHRRQSRTCEWNRKPAGPALPIRVEPLTRGAFSQLIEDVKTLKAADFPSSRMHRFCRLVRESPSEDALKKVCFETYERIPHEVREEIKRVADSLLPKNLDDCAPDSSFVKSWFDRKAIWDYAL